jgi:hypothetical protein
VNALREYHSARWTAIACVFVGTYFAVRGNWHGTILPVLLALLAMLSAICSLLAWRWGVK